MALLLYLCSSEGLRLQEPRVPQSMLRAGPPRALAAVAQGRKEVELQRLLYLWLLGKARGSSFPLP